MSGNRQTFRKLTPPVVFTKLKKLTELGFDAETICERLNYYESERLADLIALLGDREAFLKEVEIINSEIREQRSASNATRVLLKLRQEPKIEPKKYISEIGSERIDWNQLPKHLVPEMMSMGTYLAGKRRDWKGLARRVLHCRRKRMQIESILCMLNDFVEEHTRPLKILDLCGGRGDLALVIAYLEPHWSVTVMDRNGLSLAQARYRAERLGLDNFKTQEVDLFRYECNQQDEWDVVFGLHACGSLTDEIILKFPTHAKHVFIATCCFGKMKEPSEYSCYADADIGGCNTEMSRLAKLVINSQRGREISGFEMIEVPESTFSSKNQIIHIS